MSSFDLDEDKALQTAKDKAVAILIDSDVTLQETLTELQRARELAAKAGLSVESCIVKPAIDPNAPENGYLQINDGISGGANGFTGGHSNTDHVVVTTGDDRIDRIAELKRNLLRRHRAMQPEQRGDDRWDKPKIPGERRRRIVREQDRDDYPAEAPNTGWYVVCVIESGFQDDEYSRLPFSNGFDISNIFLVAGMYSFVK